MSRDIPIIFGAAMVQALLADRKSMTRRLAWRNEHDECISESELQKLQSRGWDAIDGDGDSVTLAKRSAWQEVKIGDRLWVRESVQAEPDADGWDGVRYRADKKWIGSTADNANEADRFLALYHYGKKRGVGVPSIHMPRWASRLTLIVTVVKIERLQDITEADSIAEGVVEDDGSEPDIFYVPGASLHHADKASKVFRYLWESINGLDSWTANPEIVALSFRVIQANIDTLEATSA